MKTDILKENGISIGHLKLLRDTIKAEQHLHEFLRQAWFILEGRHSYSDNWHIDAISEHLEAVSKRQIKNLLINIPPRCCKSTLISIAFPAWVWINQPVEKFLCVSYAKSLSIKHSLDCRRLIESDWYQDRWGDRFHLMKDQNAKARFDNSARGYRLASSINASVTGEGANFLIMDDPNNMKGIESLVQREASWFSYSQVLSTRLNDKNNDCRILVQQRGHQEDISGGIISNDVDTNNWVKLILPMEYEETRKCYTVTLPSTNGKVWHDPRTKEGELLWSAHINQKAVESLKQDLGAKAAAGQLQQRPSPQDGNLVKREWFKWWKSDHLPQIEFVVQSWDTAYATNKDSSYSACTTWGIFVDENGFENIILLSSWADKLHYVELRDMAKRLFFDYRDTGKIHNPAFTGKKVDMCLIEAKASGDPLIRDLRNAGINAIAFNPSRDFSRGVKSARGYGAKELRLSIVSPLIEGGRVWLPAQKPTFNKLLPFAEEFCESVIGFPTSGINDLVDTMSQALKKMKDGGYLAVPKDPVYEPMYNDTDIAIY